MKISKIACLSVIAIVSLANSASANPCLKGNSMIGDNGKVIKSGLSTNDVTSLRQQGARDCNRK